MQDPAQKTEEPLEGAVIEPSQVPSDGRAVAAQQAQVMQQAPAASVARWLAGADPMAVLQLMERMAKNKEVDTTKLAQIREFSQSILSDQRRSAFDAAFAEMQGEMPTISARGTIEIRAKDPRTGERTGVLIQSTKYAKWEDINETIKPVLQAHGFALRFVTGLAEDGRVKVTGILSGHGHREESVFILPHDSTGSKNAVQAIGSSTSYGKRYAACALLNISARGEDDDASSFTDTDDRPKVTAEQVGALSDACALAGCPVTKFLKWASRDTIKQLKRLEDIPADLFEGCLQGLKEFNKAE